MRCVVGSCFVLNVNVCACTILLITNVAIHCNFCTLMLTNNIYSEALIIDLNINFFVSNAISVLVFFFPFT